MTSIEEFIIFLEYVKVELLVKRKIIQLLTTGDIAISTISTPTQLLR
jgi:hypothetical protein